MPCQCHPTSGWLLCMSVVNWYKASGVINNLSSRNFWFCIHLYMGLTINRHTRNPAQLHSCLGLQPPLVPTTSWLHTKAQNKRKRKSILQIDVCLHMPLHCMIDAGAGTAGKIHPLIPFLLSLSPFVSVLFSFLVCFLAFFIWSRWNGWIACSSGRASIASSSKLASPCIYAVALRDWCRDCMQDPSIHPLIPFLLSLSPFVSLLLCFLALLLWSRWIACSSCRASLRRRDPRPPVIKRSSSRTKPAVKSRVDAYHSHGKLLSRTSVLPFTSPACPDSYVRFGRFDRINGPNTRRPCRSPPPPYFPAAQVFVVGPFSGAAPRLPFLLFEMEIPNPDFSYLAICIRICYKHECKCICT